MAAEYVHIDALKFVALQWTDFSEDDDWFARNARRVFSQITDFTGTKAETADRFKTHRDCLKFDPEKKMFVLSDESARPRSPANGAAPAQ